MFWGIKTFGQTVQARTRPCWLLLSVALCLQLLPESEHHCAQGSGSGAGPRVLPQAGPGSRVLRRPKAGFPNSSDSTSPRPRRFLQGEWHLYSCTVEAVSTQTQMHEKGTGKSLICIALRSICISVHHPVVKEIWPVTALVPASERPSPEPQS